MADVRIGSRPFFERGIDSIVGTPDALVLPDTHALAPSELSQPAALAEMLAAENLEALLDTWIRPVLQQRDVLSPQRFRAAMEAMLVVFGRVAESRRRGNASAGKTLEDAARVLSDEIDLRDLLQMYRSALLQG